ncbi:uncharacterized protein BHQ10_008256 [Talaromyces amestolkiae]|uniref:Uncharacterized protein n=1 Tax=Talaromyces amestolkiae TaxID=1196081 RepID=A0A364L8U7_TALAM|nr:uncharacterized protein BHQ10_008256 [Talaromyces amestolkiae]RAO72244.1 hypothetical protein BHQ10_008256 [Talaromyces amestolkiae]
MQTTETTPHEQKARLLLGACKFKGMFDCPCREGSVFESLTDLGKHMPNIPCQKCGHSLKLHDGHDGSSASTTFKLPLHMKTEPHSDVRQGLSTPSDDLMGNIPTSQLFPAGDATEIPARLCHREGTVQKIAQMLIDGESVLIWGAKGTGKTTLAHFVYEFLISGNWKAILIPSWPAATKKKTEEILLEHAKDKFPETTNEELLFRDLIFIIDEAQETLKTSRARAPWNNIIKEPQSSDVGLAFCIFSNQGIVPESYSVFASIPEISHRLTHGSGDGQLSLFFTTVEFGEYLQRNRGLLGYDLDQEAACHVYWFTAGHPTILKLTMHYIKLIINRGPSVTPIPTICRPDILAILHDEDQLFTYLGENVYPGALARQSKFVTQIFKKLLDSPEEKIGWNAASKTTIEKCVSNGLIVYEIDDGGTPDGHFFRFPSPLHAKWAQWYHKIETSIYAGELSP